MNNFLGNFGSGMGSDPFESYGGKADYKQILEQLKSGDEMMVYQAVINLSN